MAGSEKDAGIKLNSGAAVNTKEDHAKAELFLNKLLKMKEINRMQSPQSAKPIAIYIPGIDISDDDDDYYEEDSEDEDYDYNHGGEDSGELYQGNLNEPAYSSDHDGYPDDPMSRKFIGGAPDRSMEGVLTPSTTFTKPGDEKGRQYEEINKIPLEQGYQQDKRYNSSPEEGYFNPDDLKFSGEAYVNNDYNQANLPRECTRTSSDREIMDNRRSFPNEFSPESPGINVTGKSSSPKQNTLARYDEEYLLDPLSEDIPKVPLSEHAKYIINPSVSYPAGVPEQETVNYKAIELKGGYNPGKLQRYF